MQATRHRFERYELDAERRVLLADGKDVAITPRAFDLLVALVERADRVVSKNELLDLVWPKLVVEENNLQVQVSALRKLLGAQAIATVPGRGYKFTLLAGEKPMSSLLEPAVEPSQGSLNAGCTVGNLPSQIAPLFGRADDVAALTRFLEQHRLVSVVGPAGIGKTRLVQAVAHGLRISYADDVWLVELAPLSDPQLVVSTVARTLGLVIAKREGALDSLVKAIRGRRLLLVLDNCEHLLRAVAEMATAIATGAPEVSLVVTSQEPLHVAEERVNRLHPLAVPARTHVDAALSYGAVELFVARARAADPRFVLGSDNVEQVIEICARLDGIPLALELAAARVPLLGVVGLRQRLEERLRLLGGGARTALPRHQTLRAALQWSYGLLTAAEQTVFDRLGVFVGTFSLEAAQKVASVDAIDPWTVLEHLATLVDKSLVLVDNSTLPRYRLLESHRAFALERLNATAKLGAIRRVHAQAITDTLARHDDPFEGPGARIDRIAPDLDNARAAVAWAIGPDGDREAAIALAGATAFLWEMQGCADEGDLFYRTVEPWIDTTTPPRLEAHFWHAVSVLNSHAAVRREAEAARKAAGIFRDLGDKPWLFRALRVSAMRFSQLGDGPAAEADLSEARRLADHAWPTIWTRCSLEFSLGFHEYFALGRLDKAREHLTRSLTHARGERGDQFLADQAELFLVILEVEAGAFSDALVLGNDLLGRTRPAISGRHRSLARTMVGAAYIGLGDLDSAESCLRSAITDLQHAYTARVGIIYLAALLAHQGRVEDAARTFGVIDASPSGSATISPGLRRFYDQALAIIEPALGTAESDRLRAEGRALTEEEVIALAFPFQT